MKAPVRGASGHAANAELTGITELERSVLADIETAAEEYPRYRNVRRDGAEFLYRSLLSTRPRRRCVLEIGTANGYSTFWLALAAREIGAHVTSIEKQGWKRKGAHDYLVRAELLDYVDLVLGDALSDDISLPRADFVFLDILPADHVVLLSRLRSVLAPGAVVIADNMLEHRDREGVPHSSQDAGAQEYEVAMRSIPGTRSELVDVGCGFLVTHLS